MIFTRIRDEPKNTDRCHLKIPVYSVQGGEIGGKTIFLPNKKRAQQLS